MKDPLAVANYINDQYANGKYEDNIHYWMTRRKAPRYLVEEAIQEAMADLWKYKENYDPEKGPVGAWARATISNKIHRFKKAERKHIPAYALDIRALELFPNHQGMPEPEANVILTEVEAALRRYVLDPVEVEAIISVLFWGYSVPEVAASIGMPKEAFKQRVKRAREQLRTWHESRDL